MRGGLRIGRLFGIDLTVDFTWGLIFLLMSWNLTAVFQTWHPTWSLGVCVLVAIVATLLFFGSVIAHELAHALVARSFGMRTRQIRLFLFGGVSDIEHEPDSAGAEFWMAIVGPLTSFGLAFLFFVVGGATVPMRPSFDPTNAFESLSHLSPLSTLLVWLAPVNLMVGAFNLIPGFPLDGGRVLRALLWKSTGDLDHATFAASIVGRTIGWCFIVAGIAMVFCARVPLLGQGAGSGLWLAFIGWFLSSAATESYQALQVQEIMAGVRVADLMRRSGYAVQPQASVGLVAVDWFMRSREHAFPVVDRDNRLVGLVSVGDLRKVPTTAWNETSVVEIMTPRSRLAVVTANDAAEQALAKLSELDVNQLPVMDGDVLVGILSRADIARWLELRVGARAIGSPRTA